MSEFLLELFSEEIPARMQKKAMEDLSRLLSDGLKKAGLEDFVIESFVAPRRLGVCVTGLPISTPDVREERKGPKVGAPQPALDGFIRAAGIKDISEARIEQDPKKGDFYVVDIVKSGAKTTEILSNLVPQIITSFPWPKSMRWGEGNLRWVRPLHSIIALFDGQIVDLEVEGVKASNITEGHRFHGNGSFEVANFADYITKIAAANVVIDRDARKASILEQAQKICADNGLELIEDIGLLEEVCGLVDKPVVILGQMDESFLDLPPEVIRLTLRLNQKYFVANSKATGKLAPNFIVVSNVAASDGGKAIAHGNARVLAARLNDARYFWDLDKKSTLESRLPKLDKIVFHEKIGSVGEKVKRIVELAGELAPIVGADVELAKRAALLAKADLVTEMVGEFPELQGIMGRYYVYPPLLAGEVSAKPTEGAFENPDVANAIAEHYKPIGPSDNVPTNPVSIAAALADKFDTLVSFFAIGEKPTGSGDPYALRRAALGVIRIILENDVRVELREVIGASELFFAKTESGKPIISLSGEVFSENQIENVIANLNRIKRNKSEAVDMKSGESFRVPNKFFYKLKNITELYPFFLDRLKVYLRDEGFAHDVVDAVFALGDDDLARVVNRIKAVTDFIQTEDGANLIAGFKRASNILKAEEKKGDLPENLMVDANTLELDEEKNIHSDLTKVEIILDEKLTNEDFEGAMKALSTLRTSVDAFFDKVLVNDSDKIKRLNRLALLTVLRQMVAKVANFDLLRG